MEITLAQGKGAMAAVEITDAGTPPLPAPINGPPVWTHDAGGSLVVSPFSGGMSAHIAVPLTALPGTYTVTVSANGNMAPTDPRIITGTLGVVITAINSAMVINITATPLVEHQ